HIELDSLTLLEVAVALTLDRGEMHEHVGTTLLEDEPEALLRAEPLHGSVRHRRSLLPRPGRAWCSMRCSPATRRRSAMRELLEADDCDAEPSCAGYLRAGVGASDLPRLGLGSGGCGRRR